MHTLPDPTLGELASDLEKKTGKPMNTSDVGITLSDSLFPAREETMAPAVGGNNGMGTHGDPMVRQTQAADTVEMNISPNREPNFSRASGRFHDPENGMFEPGSPPPDLDTSADRYRAKDGRFKKRATDLFDEPDEVRMDSLEPMG